LEQCECRVDDVRQAVGSGLTARQDVESGDGVEQHARQHFRVDVAANVTFALASVDK
jgi:hypothetical protein